MVNLIPIRPVAVEGGLVQAFKNIDINFARLGRVCGSTVVPNLIPIRPDVNYPDLVQTLKDIDTNFYRLRMCAQLKVRQNLIPIGLGGGVPSLVQSLRDIDINFGRLADCCADSGVVATEPSPVVKWWGGLDYTSDGTLWLVTDRVWYSVDGGATWALATTGSDPMNTLAFTSVPDRPVRSYIDASDHLHIMYNRQSSDQNMCYQRGTPDGATGWSWSGQYVVSGWSDFMPDHVVAHQHRDAGDTAVQLVVLDRPWPYFSEGTYKYHIHLNVTAAGVPSEVHSAYIKFISNPPYNTNSKLDPIVEFDHSLATSKVPTTVRPNLYAMGIVTDIYGNNKSVVRCSTNPEANGSNPGGFYDWPWAPWPVTTEYPGPVNVTPLTGEYREAPAVRLDGTSMVCANLTGNDAHPSSPPIVRQLRIDKMNVATKAITNITTAPAIPTPPAIFAYKYTGLSIDTAGNYIVILCDQTYYHFYIIKYVVATGTWTPWTTITLTAATNSVGPIFPIAYPRSGMGIGFVYISYDGTTHRANYVDTGYVSP